MSSNQQIRQSELFAGQDWTVLYRAFTQINFNASDPATINQALQTYIQTNYPEDFNDWIERSEFVALIDLISWIAGTLAFRTDVNARENFLETASARESVLRLARFLSYNARRAQSARGLVKLVKVSTTQSVEDSFGTNLNNVSINWNDPDNPDWQEQFIVILNAAFPVTNPFGIPLNTALVSSITTQLYALNNQSNASCVYQFDANINGSSDTFEIVNMSFDTTGFSELAPDPSQPFHMCYMNDGLGNSSSNTGFFLMFKQGTLNQSTYYLQDPIENRTIDIATNNINQTDVWVQSLDSNSNITTQWTQVPAVITDNITYNSVSPTVQNIYAAITEDNDQVTLRFGDGTFGAVPTGNLRLWYRTVNGEQYQLRPIDMANRTINIPYYDVQGRTQTLTLTFSLQESVANAVASETIDDIRRRAPQSFASQNRMVSGEDYNVYPLTSNEIVKMHAVNRIYSGHSRYLDINDPTSTYQDTVVFSDDGIAYLEPTSQYIQIPTIANLTPEQIALNKLQPMLEDITVRDYFLNLWMSNADALGMTIVDTPDNKGVISPQVQWVSSTGSGFSSIGSFSFNALITDNTITSLTNYLAVGSLLKFKWTDKSSGTATTKYQWAEVTASTVIQNTLAAYTAISNNASALTLNENIPDGAELVMVCPSFRSALNNTAVVNQSVTELQAVEDYVSSKRPFSLWYQYNVNSVLTSGAQIPGTWSILDQNSTGPAAVNEIEPVLVGTVQYLNAQFWTIEIEVGAKFMFQSANNVQWFNDDAGTIIDANTGLSMKDHITFMEPNLTGISLDIASSVYETDGFIDPTRVVVTPTDSDQDGSPDNPEVFEVLLNSNVDTNGNLVDDGLIFFYEDSSSQDSQPQLVDLPFFKNVWPVYGEQGMTAGSVFYYVNTTNTVMTGFYKYNTSGVYTLADQVTSGYVAMRGVSGLKFQWKHYAGMDTRIDPAITNVVDAFVLTSEYDYLVRQWIAAGCDPTSTPTAPTDVDLAAQFSDLEQYKMFSDEIVWRPVQYKYLFGSTAETALQAQFKVVTVPNTTMSDGEIRSAIITAINSYFDVNNWEFGETFYFTELAAYVHIQLATAISSFVIVPLAPKGAFGDLFEVRSNSNELFISTAQVSDIVIINSNTASNLRIS
jgi:hypothetical protein